MITESILGRIIQSSGVEDARIVRVDVISVFAAGTKRGQNVRPHVLQGWQIL